MSRAHRRRIQERVTINIWLRQCERVVCAELTKQGFPDWQWFRLRFNDKPKA